MSDAADVRTTLDPRAYLRRRLELLIGRGQHGEVV